MSRKRAAGDHSESNKSKKAKESKHPSLDCPEGGVLVTCTSPVNIAVIKYWGKRDEHRILPINSSLSGTIDQETMCSTTTIIASKAFESDSMHLNDKEEDISKNKRTQAVIQQLRARAQDFIADDGKTVLIKKGDWKEYKLKIVSHNNFPTAAGLASSASGFSCLTKCLATLFNVREEYEGELTAIARMGSGSACRSLHGGFVRWEMGSDPSGRDSIASQVVSETHWPEMRVLILVANSGAKEIGSTAGMEETVKTSAFIKTRMDLVPERMKQMEAAIVKRDFHTFADLTMKDSNSFHSVCLDTYPPICYLNPTSWRIISIVHAVNKLAGRNVAAYTFDAGPNAVIYVLEKTMHELLDLFLSYFLPADTQLESFVHDPRKLSAAGRGEYKAGKDGHYKFNVNAELAKTIGQRRDGEQVFQVIVTKLGDGAKIIQRKSNISAKL